MPRVFSPDTGPMFAPSLLQRTFWWMAGADVALLSDRRCADDRIRFTATGLVTLASSGVAFVSAYVIASSYIVASELAASSWAAAWALFVLLNERSLLAGMWSMADASLARKLATNWPRLCLALAAAAAAGPAIELRIFADSVALQRQRDGQVEIAGAQRRLASQYSEISRLEQRLVGLDGRISAADAQVDQAARAAIAESDGSGGSGREGADILFEIKRAEQSRLERDAQALRDRLDPERRALAARISGLTVGRDAELARFRERAEATDDVVADLIALHHLKSHPESGPILVISAWAIWLIVALAELLPILSAIFQRTGAYEEAVAARRIVAIAEWRAWRESSHRGIAAVAVAEQRVDIAGAQLVDHLVTDALDEASTCEAARKAQEELVAEILASAVPRARRAAREAFGDDLEHEVAAVAREARRQADGRVVHAEIRHSRVVTALRRIETWIRERFWKSGGDARPSAPPPLAEQGAT